MNLVVVAHPDDEILGFGGTGAVYAQAGSVIQPVILCGGASARTQRPTDEELLNDLTRANTEVGFKQPILGSFPNIRMNTIPHIELVQFIESQIELFQPDQIFTHHPSDLNDDHKKISHASMAAARLFQRKKGINPLKGLYFMEILSSTDWAFASDVELFSPNVFVDVSKTIDIKIKALSCYRNVMQEAPHPRSTEMLRGHAAYRGGQCGCISAEAFQQVYRLGL